MILISRIRRCCSLVTVTTTTALILNLSSLSLRARGIKPGFFTNDKLVGLDPLIRLLFIGAWQAADRRGLLEDRPMKLKIQILPADDCDVDDGLYQLQEAGFVLRYHDRKAPEKRYIKIISFPKHQNPHKDEKANEDIPEYDPKKHVISTRPAQSQHGANTVSAPDQYQSKPADSWNLTPDSLLPDSSTFVNGTGGGVAGAGDSWRVSASTRRATGRLTCPPESTKKSKVKRNRVFRLACNSFTI